MAKENEFKLHAFEDDLYFFCGCRNYMTQQKEHRDFSFNIPVLPTVNLRSCCLIVGLKHLK